MTTGQDGITRWSFDVNTSGFIPQHYYVDVSTKDHSTTALAMDIFYLISPEIANTSSILPVHLDPITSHNPGETFSIGGNTTLTTGEELNISVVSGITLQSGEFQSRTVFIKGITHVKSGKYGINRWTFNLNTTGLEAGEYLIDIHTNAGDEVGYGILVLRYLPFPTYAVAIVQFTPTPTPNAD
jgi:hypothetical protein